MGYSETICQLCGVSFAIARIRSAHEPFNSAWTYYGSDFVSTGDNICEGTSGCQALPRQEGDGDLEHVAGAGCYSGRGYCGYRISVEEMIGCRAIQCLLKKEKDWKPEQDDQDFELQSDYFLTGIGDGSPDEAPADNLKPVRHGVTEVWVFNAFDEPFVSPLVHKLLN